MDVPDDVKRAAVEAVKGRYAPGHRAALLDSVTRALMAERDKCAEIARAEGLMALSEGLHALVPEVIARVIEGRRVRDAAGYSID